ncbi:bifunctional DNA-binding transcriptional regulator/antitoxin component of YhaV-PrlF toxin-antitoxin module [Azospirillum canadense]|nr:bifunctional DNA-binding transcriptional regulator/antitoxin component of YhaV-PrlF toxin-antitoxin module [Azospirillum canadense]
MPITTRALYGSANGDRWLLVRDSEVDRVFIRHEANAASGGHIAEIDIGTFLTSGRGPEQQELLRLIGTLAERPEAPTRP